MFASESDFDDDEFLEAVLSNKVVRNNLHSKRDQIQPSHSDVLLSYSSRNSEETLNSKRQDLVSNKEFTERNVAASCSRSIQTPLKVAFPEATGFNRSIERKFPGPAGLLPAKENAVPVGNSTSSPEDISSHGHADNGPSDKEHLMVESWQSMLESETWKQLLMDIKHISCGEELLKNINIKNIKEKASARLLVTQKIPFLAVILMDLNALTRDPCVTLCDQSGIMSGSLHRDALKQFGDELNTGCGLILQNIGVFSFGKKSYKNQHYLNITINNVVSLYSEREGKVRKTIIKPFCSEVILKSIDIWHSNTTPTLIPDQDHTCQQNLQHLFSTPFKNNTLPNSNISNLESPVQLELLRREGFQCSSPLSTRSNVKSQGSSGFRSPVASRFLCQNKPPALSNKNCENTLKKSSNLDFNQFSVRDSSSILNLISSGDKNTNNELSPMKSNEKILTSYVLNKTCSNNASENNSISSGSLECSSYHRTDKQNNLKNNLSCKLSKFSFKFQNSENSKTNSFQELCSTSDSLRVNDFQNKQSATFKNNVSKSYHGGNEPCSDFRTKKPRVESQEQIISIDNFGKQTPFSVSLSKEKQFVDKNTSSVPTNRVSRSEANFEQSEVESILEGLDASAFLDDDF